MKNYNVVFSETARSGLLEISESIALDNPIRVTSFIREIVSSLKQTLSVFPESGQIYSDHNLNANLRTLAYKNYVYFDQVDKIKQNVEILFIFNARQDIESFIQSL